MNLVKKYSFSKVLEIYEELRSERTEWEAEWRSISSKILPGRGVYQLYSKPIKRKLTTSNVINTIATDALQVLVSGIHGSLTSPAMVWTRLTWPDEQLNQIEPLVAWLQESEKRLHKAFHDSNFYSVLPSFYTEYAGFGTSCLYVGEDSEDTAFRFELLTVGEYAISMGADGLPDTFCRTIFMSPKQLVQKFGKGVSKEVRNKVKSNEAGSNVVDLAVIELVVKEKFQDKKYARFFYEVSKTGTSKGHIPIAAKLQEKPLLIDGFYEFPYPVARWDTIGSDTYGVGPGSRSLQDVTRLQEMEKAFLTATHKNIDPPLNVPTHLRGKVNALPGGFNYYGNPEKVIRPLYEVNFDYNGVSAAVERVEQRIQKNFYNDVFLTASRDPNASPLKATQVNAQEQEKLFRLGPVTQRLNTEMLQQVVRRCFNIMYRKGLLPVLDPLYEPLLENFQVDLISPLATAQNAARSQGTDAFMAFIGQAAQFKPEILDNLNADEATRERAEIEGVNLGILRPEKDVEQIRKQRAEQQQAEQQRQQQLEQAEIGASVDQQSSEAQKAQAEAGQIFAETAQTNIEAGIQSVN